MTSLVTIFLKCVRLIVDIILGAKSSDKSDNDTPTSK